MLGRALLGIAVTGAVAAPLPAIHFAAALPVDDAPAVAALRLVPRDIQDPDHPRVERFVDARLGVAIAPPARWVQGPATSLNPLSDPPEPVQEVARFQIRVKDASLYATPIPLTSGLVEDALAVISIGVAREGSDIVAMDRGVRGTRELGSTPGFTVQEDEATYEGLHVLTRYLFSRMNDRVLVARAAAAETDWSSLGETMRASLATFGGDPSGPNAPAPAPPPPPPPAPPPPPDETLAVRARILARAATLLGLRYVWGGNSTVNGMDCSAYVSWTWGVSRYTTDSIWNVSFPIAKSELRPGDALDLTTGRDPRHLGHIRLFEAWANAEHSAMWVFEETPPRVVHRVVAYDDRYQPIRLAGLSDAGIAQLIPGTPAPERTATPAPTRRATATATRRPSPTRTPTPRPSASATGSPLPTASGSMTPRPSATPVAAPTTSPMGPPTPTPTASRP